MNEAFIYEKVGAEDQLTSDIFGLLRYLPPKLILEPFLERAVCFDETEERSLGNELDLGQAKQHSFSGRPHAFPRRREAARLIGSPIY